LLIYDLFYFIFRAHVRDHPRSCVSFELAHCFYTVLFVFSFSSLNMFVCLLSLFRPRNQSLSPSQVKKLPWYTIKNYHGFLGMVIPRGIPWYVCTMVYHMVLPYPKYHGMFVPWYTMVQTYHRMPYIMWYAYYHIQNTMVIFSWYTMV